MLFRTALGQAIREIRNEQGKTLRDVSVSAPIALGYLSEIERARKEVSSEVLYGIATSLNYEVSDLISYANDILIVSELHKLEYSLTR
jgi:transcriptional regulator with XRE-family HTH domain